MKKINVGIIGCGAIGTALAAFIEKELFEGARLYALCDSDAPRALSLRVLLRRSKPVVCDADALIKNCQLIIECAKAEVSYAIAKAALLKSKRVLIMSIGGIVEKIGELEKTAKKHGGALYLPSGAICGLDGIQAMALAGIKKAMLITRKPPKALEGAPYIVKKGIDLGRIRKETIIFEGNASSAIRNFPKNVNVSALLSIAGIGARKTRVKIMSSPTYKHNTHEIHIESKAGSMSVRCENVAFPQNPKTSYLAALSAMAMLKSIFGSVKIGN